MKPKKVTLAGIDAAMIPFHSVVTELPPPQPPQRMVWESEYCWHGQTGAATKAELLAAGWEPFAASDTRLFFRRQVPAKGSSK